MLNFRTPLLVSFEYTQNISNIMDIILYIKNYNIQTTSITHLIPILYLNKIKSKFISIDIDFYELANKSYKLISKYRKYGV
ncbi:MAG: hypothetical protein LBU14_02635 [Candidatus Peribacteria bacterium]|jgi:hypothetical protein|nr:hypothetical protein [Candidatus Peribacteria bacterium]